MSKVKPGYYFFVVCVNCGKEITRFMSTRPKSLRQKKPRGMLMRGV